MSNESAPNRMAPHTLSPMQRQALELAMSFGSSRKDTQYTDRDREMFLAGIKFQMAYKVGSYSSASELVKEMRK